MDGPTDTSAATMRHPTGICAHRLAGRAMLMERRNGAGTAASRLVAPLQLDQASVRPSLRAVFVAVALVATEILAQRTDVEVDTDGNVDVSAPSLAESTVIVAATTMRCAQVRASNTAAAASTRGELANVASNVKDTTTVVETMIKFAETPSVAKSGLDFTRQRLRSVNSSSRRSSEQGQKDGVEAQSTLQ